MAEICKTQIHFKTKTASKFISTHGEPFKMCDIRFGAAWMRFKMSK